MTQGSTQRRTQIYLTDNLYQIIKMLSRQKNISMAEVIRDAISFYTQKTQEKTRIDFETAKKSFLKLAGIGKGPKNLAKKHDSYW